MNWLGRITRWVPPEVWALLLIAIPLAVVAVQRIDLINTTPSAVVGPNDPDPWLRLTLVRDWLEGGDWFNHEVARSNAPMGGIASPWTRPLDVAIAGLVKLQGDDASLTTKLMRAAAALPLIWMLLLMLGLFRALRQIYPAPMSYLFASALVGVTPVLWSYFGKGNADHHALLAALWAWVISYAITPEPRPRDCWIQGLLMALMLWVSPEALVLITVIYLWQLLRWLHDGQRIMPLAHLTSATAYGAVLAMVIERKPGTWLHPIYDSLSIVHVVLLALCAVAVRGFAFLPERFGTRRRYRLLAAKIAGTLVLILMAVMYPKFFHGPMADVSPFIFTDFLPRINEAKPLFAKPPFIIASLLFLPLLALACYGWMLRTREALLPKPLAAQLLFLLLVTIGLVLAQMRWYYYLFPVIALMLAPILAALFSDSTQWPSRLLAKRTPLMQMFLRLGLLMFVLGMPMLLFSLSPPALSGKGRDVRMCEYIARRAIYSGELTRALGKEPLTLYAPTNLGTEILFFTPYRIIASNYHREGESIRYVWDTTRITDTGELRSYLARRKVDAMLICPDSRASKNSVLMRWMQGKKRPDWAKRVPLNGKVKGKPAPLLIKLSRDPA